MSQTYFIFIYLKIIMMRRRFIMFKNKRLLQYIKKLCSLRSKSVLWCLVEFLNSALPCLLNAIVHRKQSLLPLVMKTTTSILLLITTKTFAIIIKLKKVNVHNASHITIRKFQFHNIPINIQ